jgi:hypothetical protein
MDMRKSRLSKEKQEKLMVKTSSSGGAEFRTIFMLGTIRRL